MSTSIEALKDQLVPSDGGGRALMSSGMGVEADRAIAQVQGAMVIAKKFPRDEKRATTRILEACQLLGVAENSFYSYRRGGSVITGASIDLLKICARYWGNIDFSMQEIDRRPGESVVLVVAIDLETNARASRTIIVPHVRDKNDDDGNAGGKTVTSQRDIYEVWANVGSRRLRACLEDLIPPHIIGMAFDACQDTLKAAASKKPLADRLREMVPAYGAMGVTEGMLVKYLGGRPLSEMLEHEYIQLRNIWKSIQSGAQRVDDFFEKASVAESVAASKGAAAGKPTQQAQQAQPQKDERPAGDPPASDNPKGPPTADEVIAQIKTLQTVSDINAIGAVIKANSKNWTAEQTKAAKKAASDRVDFLKAKAAQEEEQAERDAIAGEGEGAPE